jgi:hypothetical protein
VKFTRAVHQLESLVESCADLATRPASMFGLQVRQLWVFGGLLDLHPGSEAELDRVQVALVVDLPAQELPWLSQPPGAQHWAGAIRLDRNPVSYHWRTLQAPVWNHRIVRPVLVWQDPTLDATIEDHPTGREPGTDGADAPVQPARAPVQPAGAPAQPADDGIQRRALAAIREGVADQLRGPAPSPVALAERVDLELGCSLAGLRTATTQFAERRYAPGKLEPHADRLWQVSCGYLDLLDAEAQPSVE